MSLENYAESVAKDHNATELGMDYCKMESFMVPSHTKGNEDIKVWTLQAKTAPKKNKMAVFTFTHGGGALFGPANDKRYKRCKNIKDYGHDDVMFIMPEIRHTPDIA